MKYKLLLASLAVLIAGTTGAYGQSPSLGLNFAATDPDEATSSLLPEEFAGVIPQGNWNNLTGASGTAESGLQYDLNGTPSASSASVTWSSPNTWRSTGGNNAFLEGPDRKLTAGYLDTGNTAENGISITVEGLDAALTDPGYDVYVYFVSDSGANRGGAYTINDGDREIVKYGSTMATPFEHVEDPGTDPDLSQDGTYLRFVGLTGDSFTLTTDTTLTTPNGFRAPVNAIQIVPTEPFGPDFSTQPVSTALYAGETARFTAEAEAFPLITSFQWQRNGADVADSARISGATSTTLVINDVAAGDAGEYTLVATSPRGSATSEVATLTIVPPSSAEYVADVVEAGPLAHWRLNEPADATLVFDYVGGFTGTYGEFVIRESPGPQAPAFPGFESDNTAMDTGFGADFATVPTPALNTNTATFIAWINPAGTQLDYTGLFMTRSGTAAGLGYTTENQLGYTWNNNTTWSWNSGLTPPDFEWSMVALVIEPERATLYLGAAGSLNAAINPIEHVSEAWGGNARIGSDAGGDSRTFFGQVDEVTVFDRALPFEEIADLYATATGVPQTVPPTISPQPQPITRYAGQTVEFEASAAGSSLSFQWFKDGDELTDAGRISGTGSSTLRIEGITAEDAGEYSLQVTNPYGETTSEPAPLTVLPLPEGYASGVLEQDPLSYWRLNETGDPSTGDQPAFDYWGGRHGLYGVAALNGAVGIAGPRPADGFDVFEASNAALQTTPDTADSWVTVPGPGITTDTLTIVAWIHPFSLVPNGGIVFARAGQPATGLNLNGAGNLGYHWLDAAASYNWDSGITPPLGEWSMAALVVEPTGATLHLVSDSGIQTAVNSTNTHAARAFTDAIRIGGDPNNVNRTFDGLIDEVALFDTALTPEQIEGLFSGEPVVGAPELNITREGSQITITWDQPGTLQSTTALEEEDTVWTDEATTGMSLTVTPEGEAKFYRLVQ